jgi:zinc protease
MTLDARPSTLTVPAPPRPAPSAPRPYHFPAFGRRRLENGIQLVVAPVHKLPLVTVIALVDAGAAADPDGREGLAQITAQALTEGTATMDGVALTDRVERLGTSLDAHADWDTALLRVTVERERLGDALELLGEVLLSPAFPERELERLKAERRAEILAQRAEPRGLAHEMFDRFTYASSARYSRPEGGSETSVAAIDRGDVERFYRARYRPGSTTLVFAGDVSADEGERLAREVFGVWAGARSGGRGAPPGEEVTDIYEAARHHSDAYGVAAPPIDAAARSERVVHLVAKPDAPQSELRIGHVGLPRLHPDYFPVTVMNAVLGGLFSSRINLNLREAHGYTYGASSGYDWRRAAGPFVVSTAVRSDVTDAAAREVLHEIDRMRAEPIAEEELSLATSYLDGVFPIRYETTAAIATALANLVLYRLPDDYYDSYRGNIRGVTRDDVLAAARAHLHPDRLQIVAVGDADAIREPLATLGVGPVRVYDAEGRLK